MGQTKYETHVEPFLDKIEELISKGATDRDIYTALHISKNSWLTYKREHLDLLNHINACRAEALENVKCALYKSAIGATLIEKEVYTTEDEEGNEQTKTKTCMRQQPPNPQAIAMYLRNYDNGWRDKAKIEYDFRDIELKMRAEMDELKKKESEWLNGDLEEI